VSAGDPYATWVEQWLTARPEMRLVELYCRPARTPRARALGVLEHLLREAAFGMREPAIARSKLAWWVDELVSCAGGGARHPVTRELGAVVDAPGVVALARATAALSDATVMESTPDVVALVERYATAAAGFASAHGADAAAGSALAACWLVDELRDFQRFAEPAHARVPLALLARHGITREALAGEADARAQAIVRADLVAALVPMLAAPSGANGVLAARLASARTWAGQLARARAIAVTPAAPRLRLVYALWRARS
jgi:phytoene synthase